VNPEAESPEVEEKDLIISRRVGKSLLDRILEAQGEDRATALERVDALVDVLSKLRGAAIRSTFPSDWIIHTGRDSDGNIVRQVGYLQDCGAERAGKIFGIELAAPVTEREDFTDGTYCYHMLSEAWSKLTGERLEEVEGSRWSGDKFFQRGLQEGQKPDPVDVRKSAYANLHGRAVRALAGLNAVPLEELTKGSIDVSKVVHVDYQKGAKGGESTGAGVGTADLVIPWGNCKGAKLTDLDEADLTFYLHAYEKDVGDPAKARFQKANERMLTGIKAEIARRLAAKEQEKAVDKKGDNDDVDKVTDRVGSVLG